MQTAVSFVSATSPLLTTNPSSRPEAQVFVGSLAMDGLGLFVLLVTIVVSLMGLWASIGRPGFIAYGVQTLLLVIGVFFLVSATNMVLFFVLWEMVTIVAWSIGRRSGIQSFPALGPLPVQGIGGIGSICMLSALVLVAVENRTLTLEPAQVSGMSLVAGLLLAAVYLKTYGLLAQTWLPGEPRTAGVSNALLAGAGIMVVGFYPYVRFFWTVFSGQGGWQDIAVPVSVGIGLVAAMVALGEHDTHRLISYGALSQFAWFLAAFALFGPEQAGVLFLAVFTCTLAMSALFVLLGLTESYSGERDLRRLGGLIRQAPTVTALFILLVPAVVGLPPFGSFVARLTVELPLLARGELSAGLMLFGITVLTLLYLLRFFGAVFLGESRQPMTEARGVSEYVAVSAVLLILLVVGLTSPTLVQLAQISFAIPWG